ncbi:hypothetical protein [Sediminibacterium goheungense]|uniref:Uncharacterized protein n=1 Tax=Sediminibacterium goheungense TaxID=1086393 RepID=A0A4R6J2E3_9BACT|nr:hypothetical protein [Sediminibacterium goheungense]TDO29449.1 hypothetical protein BC659_1539 [Sediminibacterium goheungense]
METKKNQTKSIKGLEYVIGMSGAEVKKAVLAFRTQYGDQLKTNGVVYDMNDILKYIANVFIPFSEANKPKNKDEKWVVGHYFMIYNERLAFCIIPTLYNKKTGFIKDRFAKKTMKVIFPNIKNQYPPSIKNENPPGNGEAFDKGGMWP